MKFPAIGLLLLAAASSQAVAGVQIEKRTNVVFGGADYHATISGTDYQSLENEDTLRIDCFKDGDAQLVWHTGGRFDGGYFPDLLEVDLKFDNDAPVHFKTFKEVTPAVILAGAQTHKRLALRGEIGLAQGVFLLGELKSKLGPKSIVGKQCAQAFGYAP